MRHVLASLCVLVLVLGQGCTTMTHIDNPAPSSFSDVGSFVGGNFVLGLTANAALTFGNPELGGSRLRDRLYPDNDAVLQNVGVFALSSLVLSLPFYLVDIITGNHPFGKRTWSLGTDPSFPRGYQP